MAAEEARGTVVAQVTLYEILALIVVVETTEDTHRSPVFVLTVYRRFGGCGVQRGQSGDDAILLTAEPTRA